MTEFGFCSELLLSVEKKKENKSKDVPESLLMEIQRALEDPFWRTVHLTPTGFHTYSRLKMQEPSL